MAKKQTKNSSAKVAEDWLPLIDIKGGYAEVKGSLLDGGNQLVTGVRIEPKNIFISEQSVQDRAIIGLRNFYNTLDFEFWLICCDRPVDINIYRSELEIMYTECQSASQRKLISQDIAKCEDFVGPRINAVDTEYYILFKDSVKRKDIIIKRLNNMISGLAAAGITSRQVTDDDIRVILDSFFNDGARIEFGTVMSDV
jgi:hypothetical protein